MDETFLYLTTTGRTSGLPRRIEIWFVEHGGCYYVCAESRGAAHWVQNLQADPAVRFSVGTRRAPDAVRPTTDATARVVLDADEPALAGTVKALLDQRYTWSDGLLVELAPAPGTSP